jgi:hypothetical protein
MTRTIREALRGRGPREQYYRQQQARHTWNLWHEEWSNMTGYPPTVEDARRYIRNMVEPDEETKFWERIERREEFWRNFKFWRTVRAGLAVIGGCTILYWMCRLFGLEWLFGVVMAMGLMLAVSWFLYFFYWVFFRTAGRWCSRA